VKTGYRSGESSEPATLVWENPKPQLAGLGHIEPGKGG